MFTGIVEELGEVVGRDGSRLRIAAAGVLDGARIGDSTAVNGCCLTVVAMGTDDEHAGDEHSADEGADEIDPDLEATDAPLEGKRASTWWEADVSDETFARTSLGQLQPGDPVNLERPVRLADRSGLDIQVQIESSDRLPIMQERELWRIAQEAMVNVERHADATTLLVNWTTDGRLGVLEVVDDGRGFSLGESGRADSYGLVGMRERASSVGATMEVESEPGQGTTIRCLLVPEDQPKSVAA